MSTLDPDDFQMDDLPQLDLDLHTQLSAAMAEEVYDSMKPIGQGLVAILAVVIERMAEMHDVEIDGDIASVINMMLALVENWHEIIDDFRDDHLANPKMAIALGLLRDMPDPINLTMMTMTLVGSDEWETPA